MNIPVINVNGCGLAETWEKSLIELYNKGCKVSTQYDKEGDPPSLDCTMMMVVDEPFSEPMIHKDFPGGPSDLQEYLMEVCDGIKDHWVRDQNNPNDHRWEYTYHQRLFKYNYLDPFRGNQEGGCESMEASFDQIENVCQQLSKTPYTRRAQAITWKVWEDNSCYDPPCLQSIWCRIIDDTLNMNVRFRSRDAYKAAFMNCFALIHLQKKIADRVSELSNKEIKIGRYVDISDSYHIYGKDLQEFENRFWKMLSTRTFEQRTYRYDYFKPMMDDAIPEILQKIKDHDGEE